MKLISSTSPVILLGSILLSSSVQASQNSPTHFLITTPSTVSPWVQGGTNPLVWESAIGESEASKGEEEEREGGGEGGRRKGRELTLEGGRNGPIASSGTEKENLPSQPSALPQHLQPPPRAKENTRFSHHPSKSNAFASPLAKGVCA